MNEIEKLYENAGIKKEYCSTYEANKQCEGIVDCSECASAKYPPFTAEKQLELIEYFSNSYNININKDNNIFKLLFLNKYGIHHFYTSGVGFAEQLALFVISRFRNQILTEEEKQRIKEILE